jgi:hypothetical protein
MVFYLHELFYPDICDYFPECNGIWEDNVIFSCTIFKVQSSHKYWGGQRGWFDATTIM